MCANDGWRPRYETSDGRVVADGDRLHLVGGRWERPSPVFCRSGHRLQPGRALVGWQACPAVPGTGGHLTHRCRVCADIIYTPTPGDRCDHRHFDGRPS